jgi:hypothetical protein
MLQVICIVKARELVEKYVDECIKKAGAGYVKIHYTDVIAATRVAPTVAIRRLREVCKEKGGEYISGTCIIYVKQG